MNGMNWYRFAHGYDPALDPDFIGFHCQDYERSPNDDIIYANERYVDEFFIFILDALTFDIRNIAMAKELFEKPEKFTDEYNDWGKKVEKFFEEHGVRWIFVSGTKPLSNFGEYCYYVSMKEDDAIWIFDDISVNDSAYAYVYMMTGQLATAPKLIPVPEDDENNDEDDWDKLQEADKMY